MHRPLLILLLLLSSALSAAAEEFALKDGTKIVGHMIAIKGDRIEVETPYGKMLLKRSDILAIGFPENETGDTPAAAATKKDAQKIDESLDGTQYANKTGKFSLTLPLDWKINQDLRVSSDMLAGLSSRDNMRYLTRSSPSLLRRLTANPLCYFPIAGRLRRPIIFRFSFLLLLFRRGTAIHASRPGASNHFSMKPRPCSRKS